MAAAFPAAVPTTASLRGNLVDNLGSLITTPLTAGATTIEVDDTSDFPSAGLLSIKEANGTGVIEVVSYTGKTATTFTGVTRNFNGRGNQAYDTDDEVNQYFVADHFNHAMEEVIAIAQNIVDRFGISASSPTTENFTVASMTQITGSAGTSLTHTFRHTDNTNSASHTSLWLRTGGSSGGDPFITFTVDSATSWSLGIDNSDSDALVITNAATLNGTNVAKLTTGGVFTIANSSVGPKIAWSHNTGPVTGYLYADTTVAGIGTFTNHPFILFTNFGSAQLTLNTDGTSTFTASQVQIDDDSAKLNLRRPTNSRAGYVAIANALGGLRYHGGVNGAGETTQVAHYWTADSPSTDTTLMQLTPSSFLVSVETNIQVGAESNFYVTSNSGPQFRVLASVAGNTVYVQTQNNYSMTIGINNAFTSILLDTLKNVVLTSAAVATNATDGFVYVASCAGTPTGTPTTFTGRLPIVIDSSNNKLYFYSGGAWRDAGP